jgi:hypothetical protein
MSPDGSSKFATCIGSYIARFEYLTAMKIHVVVFWIVTPCNDVAGYQCFIGPSVLELRLEDPPKH